MKYLIQDDILTITQSVFTSLDNIFQHFHIGRKMQNMYYQTNRMKVNHKIVHGDVQLHPQDQIQIQFIQAEDTITPCYEHLDILYEDEIFLIVNKPCGMLVHSDGINTTHTLCNLVKGYYVRHHMTACVHPIHRLDMETTGLVIFSKILFFQPLLDKMLQSKAIQRQYYAFVKGIIKQKKLTITQAIGRNRHNAKKMCISVHGKQAQTTILVKKRINNYSFIECRLHTGRTHQIRVHLASIHHPLLSDCLYGEMDKRIQRLALHAYRIQLYHPLLQTTLNISCPLPQDMKKLL